MPTGLDNSEEDVFERIFPNSLVYCRELGLRLQSDYQFYDNFKIWTIDNDFYSLASQEKRVRQKYAQIINGSFFKRTYLSYHKKPKILVFDHDKTSFVIL